MADPARRRFEREAERARLENCRYGQQQRAKEVALVVYVLLAIVAISFGSEFL